MSLIKDYSIEISSRKQFSRQVHHVVEIETELHTTAPNIGTNSCRTPKMAKSSSSYYYLHQLINSPFEFLYRVIQLLLNYLLSPTPPPPNVNLGRPKIAIIGAGLTGVSSASHCVGHGFDCTIFEAGDRNSLGGIWAKVNNTSGEFPSQMSKSTFVTSK